MDAVETIHHGKKHATKQGRSRSTKRRWHHSGCVRQFKINKSLVMRVQDNVTFGTK